MKSFADLAPHKSRFEKPLGKQLETSRPAALQQTHETWAFDPMPRPMPGPVLRPGREGSDPADRYEHLTTVPRVARPAQRRRVYGDPMKIDYRNLDAVVRLAKSLGKGHCVCRALGALNYRIEQTSVIEMWDLPTVEVAFKC